MRFVNYKDRISWLASSTEHTAKTRRMTLYLPGSEASARGKAVIVDQRRGTICERTMDPTSLRNYSSELQTASALSASQMSFDAIVTIDKLSEDIGSDDDSYIPSEEGYELPQLQPLSHDNPFLSTESFNVEEFLLSRSHTSLPDLRSELREYLAALKEELVGLINDDYEAFISLSTDLQEEGARLEKMKLPSTEIESVVLVSQETVQLGII